MASLAFILTIAFMLGESIGQEITNISPSKSILSGGVLQTVIGNNFNQDATSTKLLLLLADNTYMQDECTVIEQTKLECLTPPVDSLGMYDLVITQDTNNISSSVKVTVFNDPVLNDFEDGKFVIKTHQSNQVEITGEYLTDCFSDSEYKVNIGEESCQIVSVTNKKIVCQAPSNSPEPLGCADVLFDAPCVKIQVSSINTMVGYLLYEGSMWDDVSIRIALLIVIFGILLLLLTIVLFWLAHKRKKMKETSNSTPLKELPSIFRDDNMHLILRDSRLSSELLIMRGQISSLALGTLRQNGQKPISVIIKKYNGNHHACSMFLKDVNTLANIAPVANVNQILGVISPSENLVYAVYPCPSEGFLLNYLRNPSQKLYIQELCELLHMAGVALQYLADHGIVHGDVAARNAVVSAGPCLQLMDRAASDDLYASDYDMPIRGQTIALRWTAPDRFQGEYATSQSDVWSYGVLMWEIMTRGNYPYQGLPTPQVMGHVLEGNRLKQPNSCPMPLYDLMTSCWNTDASLRPSFGQLVSQLRYINSGRDDAEWTRVVAPPACQVSQMGVSADNSNEKAQYAYENKVVDTYSETDGMQYANKNDYGYSDDTITHNTRL